MDFPGSLPEGDYRASSFLGCKAGIQCKDGLDADIQARHPKCLKHDLRSQLPVLRSIQGWLCKYEVVVLAVNSEVVSEALVPKSLHLIPIADLQGFQWLILSMLGSMLYPTQINDVASLCSHSDQKILLLSVWR